MADYLPGAKRFERLPSDTDAECEFCSASAVRRYSFWRWVKADGVRWKLHVPVWIYVCAEHLVKAEVATERPLTRH